MKHNKMGKHHKACIKDAVKGVTVGSFVTIWFDPLVSVHARGILAIVADAQDTTGGIIACSGAGIIVNGKDRIE